MALVNVSQSNTPRETVTAVSSHVDLQLSTGGYGLAPSVKPNGDDAKPEPEKASNAAQQGAQKPRLAQNILFPQRRTYSENVRRTCTRGEQKQAAIARQSIGQSVFSVLMKAELFSRAYDVSLDISDDQTVTYVKRFRIRVRCHPILFCFYSFSFVRPPSFTLLSTASRGRYTNLWRVVKKNGTKKNRKMRWTSGLSNWSPVFWVYCWALRFTFEIITIIINTMNWAACTSSIQ